MNGKSITLPDELQAELEKTAQAQHREPVDIVSEAVRKYLEEQSWVKYVDANEQRAKARGIKEEDVERLVGDYRRENLGR